MQSASNKTLTVHFIGGPPPPRSAVDLLLRCGVDLAATADPRQADVLMIRGDVPSGLPRKPRVVMPARADIYTRQEVIALARRLPAGRQGPIESLAPWIGRKTKTIREFSVDLFSFASAVLDDREEWQGARDEHDRPCPEVALNYHLSELERPVLDEVAGVLGAVLRELAGRADAVAPAWTFCASFDIDSAGMFRGRHALHSLGAIARQNPARLPEALWLGARVWLRAARDPHLRIREIAEMLEGIGVPATFFVQTHRSHRLDSYNLARTPELVRLLKAVLDNGFHEVGLHSSYATRDRDPAFFAAQWKRLSRLLGRGVAPVHRGHYLRCVEGATYPPVGRGVMVDSSLGFGGREGMRRGTCQPYMLGASLVEIQPIIMDTTLRYHRCFWAEAAFERAVELMDRVARVGGCFVPVWHPHNLEPFLWGEWGGMVSDLIEEGKRRGACFQSLALAGRRYHDAVVKLERGLFGTSDP